MAFKKLGSCRGNGKIFIQVARDPDIPLSALKVKTTLTNGTIVPNRICEYDNSSFILIIPLLAVDSIHATYQVLKNASFETLHTDHLSLEKIKWESRLNHKTKKAYCKKLKESDEAEFYHQITTEIWDAFDMGENILIKGSFILPYHKNNSLLFSTYDEHFSPLDVQVKVLQDFHYPPSAFGNDFEIQLIHFSLTLHKSLINPCLVIHNEKDPTLDNFLVFENGYLGNKVLKTHEKYATASQDPNYQQWLKKHQVRPGDYRKQKELTKNAGISFSVIVPLFKTPINYFFEMIDSVQNQSYSNWELILVNASPEKADLCSAIDKKCQEDERIRVVALDQNYGISKNTARGIEQASGEFLTFLDHDDFLEPDALFEYAKAIKNNPETDLLYCDEDHYEEGIGFCLPIFKPDFNLDLLRTHNYVTHFLCIRTNIVLASDYRNPLYEGAQDYNLTLEAAEVARYICHVPKILYHWRICEHSTALDPDSKPYAEEAGRLALQKHLDRLNIKGQAETTNSHFIYRIKYDVIENPKVSIIIPNKDHVELLKTCITSIVDKSTYENYEIIVVENNSELDTTFAYYKELESKFSNIQVVHFKDVFNFSKIINFGVKFSAGSYLLLLNNDTEIISVDWIESMLQLCQRENTGVVGARLWYADKTIQHAGVCITNGAAAAHVHLGLPEGNYGYMGLADRPQNFSAVTGACLMTRKNVFDIVGGFDEDLAVAFNDVDYCLKVREQGLLVSYTPYAQLFHYESLSRGLENSAEKITRMKKEAFLLQHKWASYYTEGDPYINQNLQQYSKTNVFYYHIDHSD